jgi:hypothetical protein
MSNNTIITDNQLRTVFIATEFAGNTLDLNRSTHAGQGQRLESNGCTMKQTTKQTMVLEARNSSY